ncbi:hypothetical protein [Agromyces humi]|nr:hypothetical protein [Agromyces humi]
MDDEDFLVIELEADDAYILWPVDEELPDLDDLPDGVELRPLSELRDL